MSGADIIYEFEDADDPGLYSFRDYLYDEDDEEGKIEDKDNSLENPISSDLKRYEMLALKRAVWVGNVFSLDLQIEPHDLVVFCTCSYLALYSTHPNYQNGLNILL